MTEAKTYYSPLLLICSATTNQLEMVAQEARAVYKEFPDEQVSVLNEAAETISIEMIRTLTQELSFGSYLGKVRHIVLLHAEKATIEAQNSLLKLLEEPPSVTQLWLVTHQPQLLLPTVRSRCQERYLVEHSVAVVEDSLRKFAEQIPVLSYRELSEKAEKLSEREEAKQFVLSLLSYFHEKLRQSPSAELRQSISTLLETLKFLEANTNVRLTIEHCFFTLKQSLSRGNGH